MIKLRFANGALVPFMTPALEHLATGPTASPDLTVYAWDSGSAGSVPELPPWRRSDESDDRAPEVEGYVQDSSCVFFHGRRAAMELLDRDRNIGIFWIHDSAQVPYYFVGAPFVRIFHQWMAQKQLYFIHAGAVGLADGGVLLAGKSGSGKSTSSLACLDSPLSYLGDDYCLCSLGPETIVHSIYSVAKKNGDDITRLPFLAPAINNPDKLATEKALYLVAKYFPEKILSHFPLKAILLPQITSGISTTIEPASPMSALSVIAPSTLFQLPGSGAGSFSAITKLIQQVPIYHLKVGTNVRQIPERITVLLKSLKK